MKGKRVSTTLGLVWLIILTTFLVAGCVVQTSPTLPASISIPSTSPFPTTIVSPEPSTTPTQATTLPPTTAASPAPTTSVSPIPTATPTLQSTSVPEHSPITIEGNAGFTPDNGIRSGRGTKEEPYVIENWEIGSSTNNGIEIKNTDAFFIIREVSMVQNHGIGLFKVSNAVVDSVNIESNGVFWNKGGGVWVENGSNIVIQNNHITNAGDGIRIEDSSQIVIENNALLTNFDGIFVSNATNIQMIDNKTIENSHYGIWIGRYGPVLQASIKGNECSRNYNGITVEEMKDGEIIENILESNGWAGLAAQGSLLNIERTVVKQNRISVNEVGIFWAGQDSLLEGNIINNNKNVGIWEHDGKRNIIRFNTIKDNGEGIHLGGWNAVGQWWFWDEDSEIFGNVLVGNVLQAYDDSSAAIKKNLESINENSWDVDGVGNEWSDYQGQDLNQDGIGDTPRKILGGTSEDAFPVVPKTRSVEQLSWVAQEGTIDVNYLGVHYWISAKVDGLIEAFYFSPYWSSISFLTDKAGYVELTIPKALLSGDYSVLVNTIKTDFQSHDSIDNTTVLTFNITSEIESNPAFPYSKGPIGVTVLGSLNATRKATENSMASDSLNDRTILIFKRKKTQPLLCDGLCWMETTL